MEDALFIGTAIQDMRAYRRVASILRRLGWEKRNPMNGGDRKKIWLPQIG